jgi:O-antigen ligase
MLLVLGATWRWRWRVPLPASLIAVTITAVVVVVSGAPVLRKHEANVEANNVMANRNGIWRTALAAWERYPVVGVGMRNYDRLGPERLKIILDEAGRPYDFAQYETFPHAHSLYFNTLAERGIIGSAALAAVLLAWLISLVRHRPKPDAPDETWVLWGSALGAWIVTVGVGVVNTTLHHEHAILAVVLLGLWLADLRKRSELVPTLASD